MVRRFSSCFAARTRSAAVALALAFSGAGPAAATELPAGFVEEVACDGLDQPTSIAFVRPSLFLVAVKSGDVFAVKNGRVRPTPVLSLRPSIGFERGLNGIAIAPGFRASGYLYLHYTVRNDPPFNRLSRIHLSRTGLGPEEVLVEGMPSHTGVHNGGCLRFAPDGTLFFSAGDGGSIFATNPQDLSNLAGKICRVNPDGTIPADNPFAGVPAVRGEIYAYGFRNPWRFGIDAASGRLLVNDVGSNQWEEVNDVLPGANHGWPLAEGPASASGSVLPLHAYPHLGADAAATGGVFYRGDAFPPEYEGNYFFADFSRDTVDRIAFDGSGGIASVERFATGIPRPVDLVVSPDGTLHGVSFTSGRVLRYRYTGDLNRPPVVIANVFPNAGLAPLDVTLSLGGTTDPDGDPLSFEIDFGDGTTVTTSASVLAHRYVSNSVFALRVVASDGRGGSAEASLAVDSTHEPPVPVIGAPIPNSRFAAGEEISFVGSATDPEDGPLPDAGLSWDVVFLHADHGHPFLGPLSGIRSGSFVVPNGGETSVDVGYEVRLTATDSRGARRSTSVYVWPRLTTFVVASEPPGLIVNVDGHNVVTPAEILSVVDFAHDLDAPSPQPGPGGGDLRFVGWADSADLARRVVATELQATFTAIFVP